MSYIVSFYCRSACNLERCACDAFICFGLWQWRFSGSCKILQKESDYLLKDKSRDDKIIVKKQPYKLLNINREFFLKDKSRVDKIIVKKKPYKLLNTSCEFFPNFGASNIHNLVNESS